MKYLAILLFLVPSLVQAQHIDHSLVAEGGFEIDQVVYPKASIFYGFRTLNSALRAGAKFEFLGKRDEYKQCPNSPCIFTREIQNVYFTDLYELRGTFIGRLFIELKMESLLRSSFTNNEDLNFSTGISYNDQDIEINLHTGIYTHRKHLSNGKNIAYTNLTLAVNIK